MIPRNLLIDQSTGDLDLSQGLRFTSTLQEYVVQRLDENMSFFLGEYFLDQRQGIPFHQRIIGAKPDLALLDTLLRRAAFRTVGVAAVRNMKTAFDRSTRKASVALTAVLTDGTEITEADLRRGFFINY